MDRRHFLTAASLAPFSIGVLGSPSFFSSIDSDIDLLATPELLTILDNEREVLRIGRIYREKHIEENDAKFLQQKIVAAKQQNPFGANQSLKAAITADFEVGKTVQVNGWILSITEARQCALYSLLYS